MEQAGDDLAAHAVELLIDRMRRGSTSDPVAGGSDRLAEAFRVLRAIPVSSHGTVGQALEHAAADPVLRREVITAVATVLPHHPAIETLLREAMTTTAVPAERRAAPPAEPGTNTSSVQITAQGGSNIKHATVAGRDIVLDKRRLSVLGLVLVVLIGGFSYVVSSTTIFGGPSSPPKPSPGPTGTDSDQLTSPSGTRSSSMAFPGGTSVTFTDAEGFSYRLVAHQATETATGDPQNPVTPAPPGLNYVVIDATLQNTTPDRPAPGDLNRIGLFLEVPLADIAAAIPSTAYPTAISKAQFLQTAGCSDLATFLPNAFPQFTSGYVLNEQETGYGTLWQTTDDDKDCLIPLVDGSIIVTRSYDGPGPMPAGSSADGNYLGADPIPASAPKQDLRLATGSPQGSGWIVDEAVPLVW